MPPVYLFILFISLWMYGYAGALILHEHQPLNSCEYRGTPAQ
jgi:hypothetical protein